MVLSLFMQVAGVITFEINVRMELTHVGVVVTFKIQMGITSAFLWRWE